MGVLLKLTSSADRVNFNSELLADVTVASHAQLYTFLAHEMWKGASRVRTDLVVEARMRGGQWRSDVATSHKYPLR